MNKILRYRISNWNQITQCRSNNSRNLSLSLSKFLDGKRLQGYGIKVNHANYGVLFAALIEGIGTLITKTDEEGADIPFLTTDEILKQLMKFGFYITYNLAKNLPQEEFDYLSKLEDLGYDKITRIALESFDTNGNKVWRPAVIVMKSEFNTDMLVFECKVTRKTFNERLTKNVILNITNEPGMNWEWVTYIANIADVLDENLSSESVPECASQPICRPEDMLSEYDGGDVADEDGTLSEVVDGNEEPEESTDSNGFSEYGSEVVDDAE